MGVGGVYGWMRLRFSIMYLVYELRYEMRFFAFAQIWER